MAALARSFNAMADALEVSRTELEHRGVRLGDTNRELRNTYKELERSKQQTILELSTPVLQLASRVLVLPIIGALDEERAHQIDDRLLAEVRARRARVVVIDVTGVPEIDSRVAGQLLGTVAALRLLGSRVIVAGISGELAAGPRGVEHRLPLDRLLRESPKHRRISRRERAGPRSSCCRSTKARPGRRGRPRARGRRRP